MSYKKKKCSADERATQRAAKRKAKGRASPKTFRGNRRPWILYDEYLRSEWWQKRRLIKLVKESYTCQRCGHKATQVHHKNYSALGREPDCHLEALCGMCHYLHHKAAIEAKKGKRTSSTSKSTDADAGAQ